MVYVSTTELAKHYAALAADVSSNLQGLAVSVGDSWVNSKVEGISTTSVPSQVQMAATLYAYSFILRNLYDTSIEDSDSAIWYEELAENILGSYIAQNANEESEIHPYSGNLTPTNVFMQRNKRTSYDDTDYDDVEEPNWESEE
jgi:hypothetical protein